MRSQASPRQSVSVRFSPCLSILLPLVCFVGLLFAGENWSSKPYLEWTEKEALQILTDSPWSKLWVARGPQRSSSAVQTPGGQSEDSGQHSNCCRTFGSGIGAAASDPRNTEVSPAGKGLMEPAGGPAEWFRVSWFSSMHVRQALYRLRLINGSERAPAAEIQLGKPADTIVLAVSGPSMDRFQVESLDSLRASTRLQSRKNRRHVAELQSFVPPQSRPDHLAILVFSRTFDGRPVFDPEDRELIFSTGEGPNLISVAFKLVDMAGGGMADY